MGSVLVCCEGNLGSIPSPTQTGCGAAHPEDQHWRLGEVEREEAEAGGSEIQGCPRPKNYFNLVSQKEVESGRGRPLWPPHMYMHTHSRHMHVQPPDTH